MSWFKNAITGGNYDKLQNEEREFQNLTEKFSKLQDGYIDLNQSHLNALYYLKTEREEVIKNLSLSKNLISKIKSITEDKKQVIKSDFVSHKENTNVEFQIGNVSIDFQGKLDNVSETFVKSLESSFKRLEEKKTFTKGDLKVELAGIALDAISEGISAVINLNGEVNEKRKHIVSTSIEIKKAMQKMTQQTPKTYLEMKRMIEIARVLNMHNQVFSAKYQTIQNEINKKSKFSVFRNELLNKKIIPDENMVTNLHILMQYSSEYSKFNKKAKI